MNVGTPFYRVLRHFFLIATPASFVLSILMFIDHAGVLRLSRETEIALAWTMLLLGFMMGAGWMFSAKRQRMMTNDAKEPLRKPPPPVENKWAYNIWKEMKPATRRLLALAVFLIFSTIGPLSILMGNPDRQVTWQLVAILTIASGGMSASIILLAPRPLWMILAVTFFTSCLILPESIEHALEGKPQPSSSASSVPAPPVLSMDRAQTGTERSLLGALSIVLLSSGYMMFIVLLNFEAAKRLRFETAITIARTIQDSLLPSSPVRTPWCEVAGLTIPTAEVGGDYFDIIRLSDQSIAIVIADVAGHGVGAGMISAMTKSALRSQLQHDPSPKAVLENLNQSLFRVTDRKFFVTAAYLLLDARERSIALSTAGHPPVLQSRGEDSTILDHRTASLGLAMQSAATFSEIALPLRPGDSFLLYTDGITEAVGPGGDQYGVDRLTQALRESRNLPAEQLCSALLRSVQQFTQSRDFADDATVVSVKL